MRTDELNNLLVAARDARDRGDVANAISLLGSVIAAQSNQPHARNMLGMIALDQGRFADAAREFEAAAVGDPTEPALWINAARAHRQQGHDEGELAALEAALAIDQRHFMARLRKAELHERREERGPAAEGWSAVVMLASQIEDLPPQLIETVSHGRRYLTDHGNALSEVIAARIAPARDALSVSERRRFDVCLDAMLGRRRIYHHECHGVAFPFLPADEFFARSHFQWMSALEAQTAAIRDELRALVDGNDAPLRPYVAQDSGTPQNKWTPLDHSLDWGAMFLQEYGHIDTALAARCPATMAALTAIDRFDCPSRGPTIFFSLLKPNTRIPAHTGVSNMRTIIHLPLIVPESCGFRVGGETRAWREGEAFAFDDTIEHEAWNESDQLRAVLIFDVWNPYITPGERELIRTMFEASDASGLGPPKPAGAGF